MSDIRTLLNPRSVAVIGVSDVPGKWGYEIYKFMSSGSTARFFPVNPRIRHLEGEKVYPSILDIEEPVDMIVVCVKATLVPEVIRHAVRKGVLLALIISNGFREDGRADLEYELADIIRTSNLRILGPNIQGMMNVPANLFPMFNMEVPPLGNIGIISQSGSVSAYLAEKLAAEQIGIRYLINLGNQVDLCESDFLDFMVDEPETKVVALYMEGPKHNEAFRQSFMDAAALKPLVVLKPGFSDEGRAAAESHTGSMAGDDVIFSQACRQFGAIRCDSITEFADTCKGFSLLPRLTGPRVCIFSTSGGVGSLTADEVGLNNLKLCMFPDSVMLDLKNRTGIRKGLGSVFDLAVDKDSWDKASLLLNESYEEYFDCYFLMIADAFPHIEDTVTNLWFATDKPVVVVYMSESRVRRESCGRLFSRGIPVFETPDRAMKVLRNMYAWHRRHQV